MVEPEPVRLEMSDGYEVFARWWGSDSCKGVVVYLHGIQSHGGWFQESAGYLASQGISVFMPDRRGSGRNEQDRGHAPSAARLVEDVQEAIRWAERAGGRSRVHLVGVSWGGKLAAAAHRAVPRRVTSLALVAPGLFSKIDLAWRTKLAIGLAGVVRPRRQFAIPLNDPELFTANPERIRFIRDDPLRLRSATAAFMIASRKLDAAARRIGRGPAVALSLFLADHDDIIDNQRTKTWVRDLPWSERRITQYEGTHHTLEFEPAPEKFFSDLLAAVTR